MRGRLVSEDLSIDELLSGRFAFQIPPFQRDYSWTTAETVQLLDDIASALEDQERAGNDTPYFLGTMLFVGNAAGPAEAGRQASPRIVDVVDGQQRLTTLAILIAALRDFAPEDEAAELHRLLIGRDDRDGGTYQLRLRESDAEFFQSAIQQPGAAIKSQPASTTAGSTARLNIEANRKAIALKLQKELTPQARRALVDFARSKCRVLVVSSDDFDYAYQIFLTINDRGKRLSVEDIFRGEMLGPLDREQRVRFESIIDEMNRYMDAEEKGRSKGKTFFSHLATIYGWAGKAIVTGLRRAVATRGGPKRFASDVFGPMGEAYLAIKSGGSSNPAMLPDVVHWLTALNWLERHGDDDWVPAAMLGLVRFQSDGDVLAGFLCELDRYAHGLMALGCGRPARRKHYAPILKRLLDNDEAPDPKTLFAISRDDQRQILRKIALRLHTLDPPTCKLVLLRLDAALSGRPLSEYQAVLDTGLRPRQRLTVEHVLPKGEVRDNEWERLFPRQSRRQAVAQCIGNLVLVTEAHNQAAKQSEFAGKKQVFLAEQPHPMHLTEQLRGEQAWDQQAIERRYELLMDGVRWLWELEGPVPKCPSAVLKSE